MSGLHLFTDGTDWGRRVALAVNALLDGVGYPFGKPTTEPTAPKAGQAYFDEVTNKARIYDGSTWQDLW